MEVFYFQINCFKRDRERERGEERERGGKRERKGRPGRGLFERSQYLVQMPGISRQISKKQNSGPICLDKRATFFKRNT